MSETTQNDKPEKRHLFDDPKNVKRVLYILYAICAGLFIGDFFINRPIEHPWEALFGFYAIFGFTACVLLVLGAKEMRKIVMRKEDYYDD
jgi:hypothetical protein